MFTRNLLGYCPEFSEEIAVKYKTLMILNPLRHEYPALVKRPLMQSLYQQVRPMLLPGFYRKTLEAFITTWCFKVPNRVPLDLVFKECAHLLIMTVIPPTVVTKDMCDFAVIFSIRTGHEALMLFCKAAIKK